jgi:hypothetical protein
MKEGMQCAASRCRRDIVQLLVDQGANLDTGAEERRRETALICKGIDPNGHTNDGMQIVKRQGWGESCLY